jgi:hypothetical protein
MTLLIPDGDGNLLDIIDKISPSAVQHPTVCGDSSTCQPTILNYEKDDEELIRTIYFGVTVAKMTTNPWDILTAVGIVMLGLVLIVTLIFQIYRTCTIVRSQNAQYASLS